MNIKAILKSVPEEGMIFRIEFDIHVTPGGVSDNLEKILEVAVTMRLMSEIQSTGNLGELNLLYKKNKELIDGDPEIIKEFSKRKSELML